MTRRLYLFGALLVAVTTWGAAPLKLDSLKVGSITYSNVTVLGANVTDLYFTHDQGIANVKLKYVGSDLQKRFNYDPAAAAQAERKQAEDAVIYRDAVASNFQAQVEKRLASATAVSNPAEYSLSDPVADTSPLGKPGPALKLDQWVGDKPSLEGKAVLLYFWAPWSAPCRKQISSLNALQKKFAERLAIVGVASESLSAIEAMTEPKLEFACALDPQRKFSSAAGINSIPTAVLLDAKGVVRYHGHPAALNDANLAAVLAQAGEQ